MALKKDGTVEQIPLVPHAAKLLQSMRDIGYSFETAVADVIDNSITAGSHRIWIDADWNNGRRYVAITDDGHGMDQTTLVGSMRLASTDSSEERSPFDLGRFGLGLKTASLSQCRRLTVASKAKGQVYAACWDIDIVRKLTPPDDWKINLEDCSAGSQDTRLDAVISERLNGLKSGTVVLWDKIDRPDAEATRNTGGEKAFTNQVAGLREHLALTYHRFLGASGRDKVHIYVNGDEIEGLDPFNSNALACKQPAPEVLFIRNERVEVTPFVLPHPSKVSAAEYRKYEGKDGYLENAGFYIYRNKRLICKGTWYRLVRRSNLSKLLRIQVDIPTSLDSLWNIDVRKSQSEIPSDIRDEMKRFIERWEDDAKRVYHHRGTRLIDKSSNKDPLWSRTANDGIIRYAVNRENLFLQKLHASLPTEGQKMLALYLDMVDASFPADTLVSDLSKDKETVKNSTIVEEEVLDLLRQYRDMMGEDVTEEQLLSMAIFRDYPDIVRQFVRGEKK